MSPEAPTSMNLKVISPHEILFDGMAEEVTLPGLDGYLGILPGHRPLFAALGQGEMSFQRSGRKRNFSVRGGYAEISQKSVLVFINPQKQDEHSTKERG